ncbi:MAG: topoisomerase [Thermoproteota archaeon]|nr:topoisomerase [Thermoproteota archaeon]
MVSKYEAKGFRIHFKGKELQLAPLQEEMTVAWVKKQGTEYVKDRVFIRNFFRDFSKALDLEGNLTPADFDFSEIQRYVEAEKNRRFSLSKEEKKQQVQSRKIIREANKEKYGYAWVDGVKAEVGNYIAEPSSIFMGRGTHPLRGRWKQGATERDIILNLSPDAPTPLGDWKARVWLPDCMWIARWDDKLSGKEKYVWLSDTAPVKQEREIGKFDKARTLEDKIGKIKKHIFDNLSAPNLLRRKTATVCYLIDALKLRVGDEKDKDEADTVGATTLRPEHVSFSPNGRTIFDFYGKDYVRWHVEIDLPDAVNKNLRELMSDAKSSIFSGVKSENVKNFLSEIVPGLTAKVFRTYHATTIVENFLNKEKISESDPDYMKKYVATMANLQAARICNHKRKLPKNWQKSLSKKKETLKRLRALKTKKSKERVQELKVRIETFKETKDYNLRTSLKSYIDPRAYFEWGKRVGYDWRFYYPKTLQNKFEWVEGKKCPIA